VVLGDQRHLAAQERFALAVGFEQKILERALCGGVALPRSAAFPLQRQMVHPASYAVCSGVR
jgi:hypothetical protein